MHNGGVVLTAELAANFGQGSLRQVLGQIHGHLPRIYDGARVVLSLDLTGPQPELLSHRLLNGINSDLLSLRLDEVLEHRLRGRQSDLNASQRAVGDEADERSFQLANVAADVAGNEQGHFHR